ncbi:hypothetical protein M430DRAFT_50880 [Amorphotheca resinae ATCC 22711]|uniref:Aminoglycoside phosphotransferase domain-containing protein n=1 Tax=Amorphotheca resinae ATCC 22711 TaxID=857342 RepID=A0A2T3AZD8_AMORE|nr:hypothetical protein M430DRAFT_50880 [Amorphotheca resinae ATCC 22711]PSS16501.1 hypothetical protein M430DRAFT_50880 [Amorphotheca resinae ATCC 22711]
MLSSWLRARSRAILPLRRAYPDLRVKFYLSLFKRRSDIEAIVSHHLRLRKTETCHLGEFKDWKAGSFNVCIPVYINNWAAFPNKRVIIRFPLPYKVGESRYPGNADEKLRCEAASFIWIQDNCPTVPIPYLWGFGFSDGRSFTKDENVPFLIRLKWNLRRTILSMLGYPVPCRYISRRCPSSLGVGYLIMDYIEDADGRMLSESWEELHHDPNRRTTLFRDMSRIILALGQLPMPRIGSLTIDNRGVLSLTNRPLTCQLQIMENGGIPTNIDRNLTYSNTGTYLLDLLAYHDSRIRYQPNSIRDEFDGRAQMATLVMMRALLPNFVSRDLRHGPFVFSLTDLHQSNILVDSDWRIKCLIDLEWACSLPIEMQHPPCWLTGRAIDELQEGEHLEAFTRMHTEFLDAFEKEERLLSPTKHGALYRTNIMRTGWKIGNFWYFHALESPKGIYNLFFQHIQPRFAPSHNQTVFDRIVAPYWATDADEVIASKIKDFEVYTHQLQKAFGAAGDESGKESSDG